MTLLNQRITAELVAPSLGYKLVENRLVTSDVTISERDCVTV